MAVKRRITTHLCVYIPELTGLRHMYTFDGIHIINTAADKLGSTALFHRIKQEEQQPNTLRGGSNCE